MNPIMRAQRIGKLTASNAHIVMGGLDTKQLEDYVASLAFERVYGDPKEEGFRSAAMDRGNELEARALVWYEFDQDCIVTGGGECIAHPTIPFVAASPDALRPDRVIEAKCFLHKAWMDAYTANEIPARYRWQVRWQQWTLGVRLVDFVVWHPIAGGFVVQRSVTEKEIEQMTQRAYLVNEMVNEQVALIQQRRAA